MTLSRSELPECLFYYRDAAGLYHYAVKTTNGTTLTSGATPRYLEMLDACPYLTPVRITEIDGPRPVPRWALTARTLCRFGGYDVRVAYAKARLWEIAMCEAMAWTCAATLTYIAWPV